MDRVSNYCDKKKHGSVQRATNKCARCAPAACNTRSSVHRARARQSHAKRTVGCSWRRRVERSEEVIHGSKHLHCLTPLTAGWCRPQGARTGINCDETACPWSERGNDNAWAVAMDSEIAGRPPKRSRADVAEDDDALSDPPACFVRPMGNRIVGDGGGEVDRFVQAHSRPRR